MKHLSKINLTKLLFYYYYPRARGKIITGAIQWNCISFAKYQLTPKHLNGNHEEMK